MNDFLKNVWIRWLGGLLLVNVFLFVHYQIVVAGATRAVIKQLQQYSPSPYGPTFNPDKVNPDALNQNQIKAMNIQGSPETVDFRSAWESSRATPVQ